MQVHFESRDPEAAHLRDVVERRVHFAMRRLSWLVPRARVQLSDVNGPRGGVDKRCRIELKTDTAGSVVVTSMARDWRSALERALTRAARTLLRAWRRGHEHGHERGNQRGKHRGGHARAERHALALGIER